MKRSQNVGNILHGLCKASVRQDSLLYQKKEDSNYFLYSFISFLWLLVCNTITICSQPYDFGNMLYLSELNLLDIVEK